MSRRYLFFNTDRIRFVDKWPMNYSTIEDIREELNSLIPVDAYSAVVGVNGEFTIQEKHLEALYKIACEDFTDSTLHKTFKPLDIRVITVANDGLTIEQVDVMLSAIIKPKESAEPETKANRRLYSFEYNCKGYAKVFKKFVSTEIFLGSDGVENAGKITFTLGHPAATGTDDAVMIVRLNSEKVFDDEYVIELADITPETSPSELVIDTNKVDVQPTDKISITYKTKLTSMP